ncbi:MAG TPA: DUF6632 domain-containing protein [Longimicrobiales bacterium]|nr:DUF6632 domain-containing protein [Longimicrobiales bacterium]
MNKADRSLAGALTAVGLVFIFGIWPLMIVWPSGWSWHPAQGEFMGMMIGLYATLGVFLLIAARRPREYVGLIWFTVWSSAVHGVIMGVQAVGDPEDFGHFYGDVPALLMVAAVLAVLVRRATATAAAAGPVQ